MLEFFSKPIVFKTLLLIVSVWFLWFSQNHFDDYVIRILSMIFIFTVLAVSYNLINGVAGQLSLEPNGFVAIGAYVAAICLLDEQVKIDMFQLEDPHPLVLSLSLEFVPALLLGGVVASLIALFLSFPVFRVRGDYLAIVTLGFGFIIRVLAINNPEFTNGSIGLNEIPNTANLYWCGGAAIAATVVVLNIVYSKYGRAMRAVRDDEDAAEAIGINVFWIKTAAFMSAAFLEGVGGGLLASVLTTISPDLFTFFLTFELIIIIVLGGLGSTTGAIIATVLVIGGGEWLRFLDEPMNIFGFSTDGLPGLRMVVFSILLIVIMLFAREGIMGKKELFDFWKKSDS